MMQSEDDVQQDFMQLVSKASMQKYIKIQVFHFQQTELLIKWSRGFSQKAATMNINGNTTFVEVLFNI